MFNIKIENIEKIDNLFETNKTTSLNIIKTKINSYTENIINNLDILENDIYIGNIKDNKIEGEGIILKKNKILIEGVFNNNIIENSNCNINNINLKGTIKDGNFILGSYNFNNIQMNGHFKEGLPNGLCKYKNNNIIYDGEWLNGKLNGLGFYEDDIFKYQGEWINNKFNGEGKLITNEYTYNGIFINGEKNGPGKLKIDNMEYFVEYENNNEINRLSFNEKKILDLENNLEKLKQTEINNNEIIKTQETEIINYNNKLKHLERDKKNIEETFLCKICFKNTPQILLNPCHHLCLCEQCESHIRTHQGRKCPICRKKYNDITKIFMG